MQKNKRVYSLFILVLVLGLPAWAGGGGQDLILVVNPNDENSLRIANAYAALRHIPESNIIFDSVPTTANISDSLIANSQFHNLYVNPIANAINQRGLDHVDYISLIGQSSSYVATGSNRITSLTTGLSLLTPISRGLLTSDGPRFNNTPLYHLAGATPNNTAIHHADVYSESFSGVTVATQYYMTGALGYTGFQGNTANQVIANLQYTVSGDGVKPQGRIYFEENDGVRSNTRESQWAGTKADLTARGIGFIEERNVLGGTPLNRTDVRGAVVGDRNASLPNGSTYLPGSWADNLTSYGSSFIERAQTKSTDFFLSGVGATSGTVAEPYATSSRFPNSDIFVHIADGSTLGEAYNKTVRNPDLQMFIGDLLAQPYADIPVVSLTGITDNQTVAGQVALGATASLSSPTVAIKQMELYIDGKPTSTPWIAADGTFNIDTTQLSDGRHEIRVVALNNTLAESEGAIIRHLNVNNHNRSVNAPNSDFTLEATQVAAVAVHAQAGDGSVSRVELRQLGRVIGSLNSAVGEINIDAAGLAYGDNRVVPVAIFTDGSEVAGNSLNVHRSTPPLKIGRTPAAVALRTQGAKVEFFEGQGAASIATSDYSGTADHVMQATAVNLFAGGLNRLGTDFTPNVSMDIAGVGLNLDQLAVRVTARFEIAADDAGEYQFFFYRSNDSVRLFINGEDILGFDNYNSGRTTQFVPSVFLGAGEHDLTLLAANRVTTLNPDYFDISLMYRGPDGISRVMGGNFLYTAVPEPTSAIILMGSLGVLLGTGRKRRG